MKPVAAKVLKEIRKARGASIVSLAAAREAKELARTLHEPVSESDGLPPNHEAWMGAFKQLGAIASLLLDTHALRKLGARIADADEEYMPGGPPQSPVLDSVFMSWWMADLGSGPMHESLCSILAETGAMLGLPAQLVHAARLLDESRLGVYRVTDLGGDRVQLDELVTDVRIIARVPDDLTSRGPLWLTRVLPPLIAAEPDCVVWTTPYLLDGPTAEADWQAYCQRAIASDRRTAAAEALALHFKAKSAPQRFLEYIMDGYAGESAVGEIVLIGVPDRPQTLPHHAAYEESAATETTPLHRVRVRLMQLAGEERVAPIARDEVPEVRDERLAEARRVLGMAFRMYGELDEHGQTALERLLRDAASLPRDEQAALHALDAGWFSVFEIKHVRVDEGLDLRDLLNARSLSVSERAATRQVDIGDLVAGWVMVEGERVTLDGALCHVPARLAEDFMRAVKAERSALGRKHKNLRGDKRDALLAPRLVPMLEQAMQAAPPLRLVNHDGDDLVLATARFAIVRAAKVAAALESSFEPTPDGAYLHIVDAVPVARISSSGDTLHVECNSMRRLKKTKELLRKVLGSTIEHIADDYEDPASVAARTAQAPSRREAAPLPAEAAAAISAMMVDRMRSLARRADPHAEWQDSESRSAHQEGARRRHSPAHSAAADLRIRGEPPADRPERDLG